MRPILFCIFVGVITIIFGSWDTYLSSNRNYPQTGLAPTTIAQEADIVTEEKKVDIFPAHEGKFLDYRDNEITFPRTFDEISTVAGKLEIIEPNQPLDWQIKLDGKVILEGDDLPPVIEKDIHKHILPFEEVIVLTQESGTCCEIGNFRFLGLSRNKSYKISKSIGDGFAYRPTISIGKDFVQVKVRGGNTSHHFVEEPYLFGRTWVFENGKSRKIR